MHIAIFTNNYLPTPYGVAGSIESFRNFFERSGHRVSIFAPQSKGYSDLNTNVYRYPSISIPLKIQFPLVIPYSRKISTLVSDLDFDIIHAQHPYLLGLTGRYFARKKNIPFLFTWHAFYEDYAHYTPLIPTKLAAWWAVNTAVSYANSATHVVVPTQSVYDAVIRNGVVKPLTIIPTGVEESFFQKADGQDIRRKFNIAPGQKILLTLSRLTEEKNVTFVVESVLSLLKRDHNLILIIAGEGNKRPEIEKIVHTHGSAQQVFFAGKVNRSDVKNYLAAADVFIYGSKSETQGMIISEALYMGLPVVAVTASGVKDIVEDKKTGFLVSEKTKEFAHAVSMLLDSPELCHTFRQNAYRISREKYTSTICGQKMLDLYTRVLS